MSGVILATTSLAFEQRTRKALGAQNGSLTRYDSEVMYIDPLAAVKDIAKGNPDVLLIGPNVALEASLALAAAMDEEHPEIEVVLVADPTPELWKAAVQSGVRDVLTPEAGGDEIRVTVDKISAAAKRRGVVSSSPPTGSSSPTHTSSTVPPRSPSSSATARAPTPR